MKTNLGLAKGYAISTLCENNSLSWYIPKKFLDYCCSICTLNEEKVCLGRLTGQEVAYPVLTMALSKPSLAATMSM